MAEPSFQTIAAADHAGVLAIYNHYIRESPATFDTHEFSLANRAAWFAQFDGSRWQCITARLNGQVVGYANTGQFKVKPAYSTSVEASVYVHPEHHGSGIGSALYTALFEAVAQTGIHRIYAGITLPNDGSVALHERFDFHHIGTYREVGFKFDRYWDVAWFEKAF